MVVVRCASVGVRAECAAYRDSSQPQAFRQWLDEPADVEPVLEPKSVPVDRGVDGGFVRDRHEDLTPLLDPQRGTRDRTVVGQHDVRTGADPLDDRCHPQAKGRPGGDIDDLRRHGVLSNSLPGIS